MIRPNALIVLVLLFAAAVCRADDAVQFDDKGELRRPADFREWPFLTSGLGMTYGPNRPAPGRPPAFSNVFVNPEAYRAFMKTGQWPNGTMFVLEIRRSVQNASINNGGYTQGDVVALEASVKDTERFADGGWAYFSFDSPDGPADSAAPFPRTADCYACHSAHGAVEWTFAQFYPRQFEVAKRLGTVRADYDPERKVD